MRIKTEGGSVRDDEPPLCFSCRHATIVRGSNLHDEIVECARLNGELARITFAVKSCSAYDDKSNTSLAAIVLFPAPFGPPRTTTTGVRMTMALG